MWLNNSKRGKKMIKNKHRPPSCENKKNEENEENEDIHIHDLRQILATYGVNELGISAEHIAFMLGHTSTDVTFSRYIKTRPEVAGITVEKILKGFLDV